MKIGWRETAEGIELLIQKNTKTLEEKENFKYLVILKADTIKQVEMKWKIKKSTSEELENLSKSKLCYIYLIKEINTSANCLVKYFEAFLRLKRCGN